MLTVKKTEKKATENANPHGEADIFLEAMG